MGQLLLHMTQTIKVRAEVAIDRLRYVIVSKSIHQNLRWSTHSVPAVVHYVWRDDTSFCYAGAWATLWSTIDGKTVLLANHLCFVDERALLRLGSCSGRSGHKVL